MLYFLFSINFCLNLGNFFLFVCTVGENKR